MGSLSVKAVEAAKAPLRAVRLSDGDNLYLNVTPRGAKSWVFLFKRDGKQREMGLGSAKVVSLADAREAARKAREALKDGRDPLEERNKPAPIVMTFGDCADAFVAAMEVGWRNEKHRDQWRMTLRVYAAPLRPMAVDKIVTGDVLKVLTPIWNDKHETASRLRGRIEAVLDFATAHKQRSGENPAAWRGNLKALLPPRPRFLAVTTRPCRSTTRPLS